MYDKLLKVTGGKERIKYFVSDFLKGYETPANFDEYVKHLHAVKTKYYTTMLGEGHIPLRPGVKQLITDAYAAGITLAIATTTTPRERLALCWKSRLGKDWENIFRGQRLRRHRAAQEACTRHIFLGAGQDGHQGE